MGKASRWFRSFLRLKKSDPTIPSPPKRRWSFVKSSKPSLSSTSDNNDTHADPYKHAIAVAAATAAVAEAAVAAAHAAAEVVRLTSSGRCGNNMQSSFSGRGGVDYDEHFAAVKIQAAFRGYLARKALRALKSVVSLQALVRGHLQRKRTAAWLSLMQYSVLQAKTHGHGGRVQLSESSHSSGKASHFQHPGPPTPEKFEYSIQARSGKYEPSSIFKRTGSKSNGKPICDQDAARLSFNWSEFQLDVRTCDRHVPMEKASSIDNEKGDKVPEVDAGKPHKTPKRRNLLHSYHNSSDLYCQSCTTSKDSATHQTVPSPSSGEVQSLSPLKFTFEEEEAFCTADNSPQFYSASSQGGSGKRNPFTPTKSDGSRSFLSSFSDYPNYMAYTESSKAKVRSLSAPKQRPQYERSTSTKRYSIHGYGGEARSSSAQRASALRANFTSKAYPGSGRLDRLGMPIGQRY